MRPQGKDLLGMHLVFLKDIHKFWDRSLAGQVEMGVVIG